MKKNEHMRVLEDFITSGRIVHGDYEADVEYPLPVSAENALRSLEVIKRKLAREQSRKRAYKRERDDLLAMMAEAFHELKSFRVDGAGMDIVDSARIARLTAAAEAELADAQHDRVLKLKSVLRQAPMPIRESSLKGDEWHEKYDGWWHENASEESLDRVDYRESEED